MQLDAIELPESTGGTVVFDAGEVDEECDEVTVLEGVEDFEELLGELVEFKEDLTDVEDIEEAERLLDKTDEEFAEDDSETIDRDDPDEGRVPEDAETIVKIEEFDENGTLVDCVAVVNVDLFEDIDEESDIGEADGVGEPDDASDLEAEEAGGDDVAFEKVDVLDKDKAFEVWVLEIEVTNDLALLGVLN